MDLEARLRVAISRGSINADNKNYSAPLDMTIAEAEELLLEVRSVKQFLATQGLSWETAAHTQVPTPFAFHPDD